MTQQQKEQLMKQLDAAANQIGNFWHLDASDTIADVMKHLEIALDLLDGVPTKQA